LTKQAVHGAAVQAAWEQQQQLWVAQLEGGAGGVDVGSPGDLLVTPAVGDTPADTTTTTTTITTTVSQLRQQQQQLQGTGIGLHTAPAAAGVTRGHSGAWVVSPGHPPPHLEPSLVGDYKELDQLLMEGAQQVGGGGGGEEGWGRGEWVGRENGRG
jgi:hypothetical protein